MWLLMMMMLTASSLVLVVVVLNHLCDRSAVVIMISQFKDEAKRNEQN
jgi:hypothetical protein